MFHINLNKKIFWIVASLIVLSNTFVTLYIYKKTQAHVQTRALARADSLKDYFLSMRYVYHHQFLKSGFDINDTTIGFLPAHASTLISDRFEKTSKDDITIRNVTDRFRNPKNLADAFELEAIEYFKNNPQKKTFIRKIEQNGKEVFQYASPLIIDRYCITCHGKKEEVLPSIRERYESAYDYKVGDIRGITSIKIPTKNLTDVTMSNFYKTTILAWLTMTILLVLIYFAIRELTLKDVEQKKVLHEEIRKKTADLQKQKKELQRVNKTQKHLFSILRTVADCNQILITAKSIEELINQTAVSMHDNTTFASVKILLFEDDALHVKASVGLDEEFEVLPIEEEVFQNNRFVFIQKSDSALSRECKEKIQKHNISEIYAIPLRKEHYAKEALGVMSISTKEERGLSKEEQDMINELAGDVGFALNSFYQKEAIKQLSFYDLLTGLANQNFFENHLRQAFSKSAANSYYGAVFFIDFDNFKNVNDLMGKDSGDIVLVEIAKRLTSHFAKNALIARHGSDKFLLLLENLATEEHEAALSAKKFATQMQEIVQKPFSAKKQSFYLTCSIGIVLFFDHTISAPKLLNQAEYAMRTAKENGKNTLRFYDESLQEITKSRSKMVQNMKEAILKKEFVLYYQKQFDIDENIIGVEVLLRWPHPLEGFISPEEFIPLAEESALIKEIGGFVLQSALQQLYIWKSDPIKKEWRLSVNISPLQFREKNFVKNLTDLVEKEKIDPAKLRLELTENILIQDKEEIMQKIRELKALGVSISIDDFGTGYSSLGYLKHLDIDELKIDQSFVLGLQVNNSDKTIIKTTLMMGKEFGFEVIAEGVETQEQFEELKQLGCNYFQGYLFAKPSPADKL